MLGKGQSTTVGQGLELESTIAKGSYMAILDYCEGLLLC